MNDTLRELRSLQAGIEQDTREYFRAMRWFLGGILLGAGGMFCVMFSVYEQPKTKPVVTVEQLIAEDARHLQRVKELRFSLEKLERAKAVQDAFLKHASTNQGSIREMVAKLGEGK